MQVVALKVGATSEESGACPGVHGQVQTADVLAPTGLLVGLATIASIQHKQVRLTSDHELTAREMFISTMIVQQWCNQHSRHI